ncbi:homoserine kinase [Psychrobium sp. 1_MG-2023]|uniref:homoserine kinase n=1 Tax=Psychrobium sp. 1_MG-2023 TaxID=3062624 RepID=UPI000C33AA62|nr:homoserine kinase [Psychrobium sp. 1_MG-2023]MDP2559786.1 homoserine kinase [Psychrobium sp. 1_MG-2023]PKF59106.1 homoserine kinase [Alteromonadales bacterium alter-6D02]
MTIRVYAPASMGNVSVGFDVLGGALAPIDGSLLGDCVSLAEVEQGIEVSTIGKFAHKLPSDPKQNILYDCAVAYQKELTQLGKPFKGVSLVLEKELPVGSGLGSSASSVVAALYGLNEFYDNALSKNQLLLLMGQLEGQISGSVHFDNVAPSYLGGLQLMVERDDVLCSTIPSFDDWYWVVAFSGAKVSTAEARALMPNQVELKTALKFGQNLAAFIDASHRGNSDLAASLLVDIIAEPVRAPLIPGFVESKNAMLELGAMASGISGSGPTLFAVTTDLAKAQQLQDYLQQNYIQNDDGFSHICKLDTLGARREALRGTV